MQAVITTEDDIDGSEAVETIAFALDSTEYEIDLSASNAEELREVMEKYVAVARRAAGRPGTNSRGSRHILKSMSIPL